jgi:hypothetical protein
LRTKGAKAKMHYKTVVRNFYVSTLRPFNIGRWETCIFDGDSQVVAQYETAASAETGHKEWVQRIENTPDFTTT